MRLNISLSSCVLDARRDTIRLPTRRLSLREPDFESQFDFTTLIYDAFWDERRHSICCVSPPLLNLQDNLTAVRAHPSGETCPTGIDHRRWLDIGTITPPQGTTALEIDTTTSRYYVAPQPNHSDLFRGRRTVFTMNKNNKLEWIHDWVRFYVDRHGCDAVLLYDNGSEHYTTGDLHDAIQSVNGTLVVAVVPWPFPYGVFDGRLPIPMGLFDSFYSQAALFEHARRRFLQGARSVLNADIDELSLCEGGRNIFELVEQSDTGYIQFYGWWIEVYAEDRSAPVRHKNYFHRHRSSLNASTPKWALRPEMCPAHGQWDIHRVSGVAPDRLSGKVHLRHFKAINTNWDIDGPLSPQPRSRQFEGRSEDLVIDLELKAALAEVFPEAAMLHVADLRPREMQAYAFRLASEEKRRSLELEEAVRLATRAIEAMPGHPGLRRYRGALLAQLGSDSMAEQDRREAQAILQGDAVYLYKLGFAALSAFDYEQGTLSIHEAIRLDPLLLEGHVALVRHYVEICDFASAQQVAKQCRVAVPHDDPQLLSMAAETCMIALLDEDALQLIDKAIACSGSWSDYRLRARILHRLGRHDEAVVAIEKAICQGSLEPWLTPVPRLNAPRPVETGPLEVPHSQLWMDKALMLLSQARSLEAVAAGERAVEMDQASFQARWTLARALVAAGRTAEAELAKSICIALVRELPAIPSSSGSAPRQLLTTFAHRQIAIARALYGCGEVELARRAAIELSRQERLLPNQYLQILEIYLEWKESELAAALASAASERVKGSWKYALLVGRLALNDGDFDGARQQFERTIELWPRHAPAHAHLGFALSALQRPDEAVKCLQQAIAMDPKVSNWRLRLADLLLAQRRPTEAVAVVRDALLQGAENPRFHFVLGRAYRQLNRIDEAIHAVQCAIQRDGSVAGWHHELAAMLNSQKLWAEAIAAAQRAIAINPQLAPAYRQLSVAQHHLGNLEAAQEAIRRADELSKG